ncbi:LuxR C-terminal-related transcriptional regulator [Pseudomonas sp. Bout1]|uniref:LuxR C-terminal-related transcriptional regulator n=1 Tax=Pseudomonas sp. Bout1 TaxID=3048600 RepID=UPI002AB3CFDF|nr:LuxR C-terminal-related transcriptional regulator [Pseudomonas sp. Bout1]MDY7534033.1 LuxR C-terminal-related transcriptional regulator [Pseudomonas sp. Bout1]MEB0186038.1 LuxR C-terminal-related transcriptional regulator [Pseudomonas sp. Bout1]
MNHDPSSDSQHTWRWIGKLTPPLTLLTSMPRHELLASLKARVEGPLILLVAPPGYGKTTLLMQWRQELLHTSPDATVAWLSLDEADAEPNRFLAYLILALDHAGLDLGHLPRLAKFQSLDAHPQRTITALLHAMARENRAVTLLLDDYHTAANEHLEPIVQALLEQAAPWLQWVVTSRTRPRWPLARWKTMGWVHEVSARELALSTSETSSILGPDLSSSDLHHLHETTEGWPVAVQLARLWRASCNGSLYSLSEFSGHVTDIAAYLTEQVVGCLPQACQCFLIDTSLLERFNAGFADAIRGRTDSAQLLAQLSHLDALLVPLDAKRQWFRYHRLLRDFLSKKCDATNAQRIHRAAAHWLAQEKDWIPAVSHALRAGDTALAVNMVVRAGGWESVLSHGIRYAQSLLRQFDEPTRRSEPDLLLLQAYLHAKLGDHALATQLLQLAHGVIQNDRRLMRDFQVIQTLVNAYVDRFEDSHTTVFDAAQLHGDEILAQATLECVDALGAMTRGELAAALQTIRAAHIKMRVVNTPRGENYCRVHEGQVLALMGNIAQSSRMVDEALAISSSQFGSESSVRALVGCLKAQHLYWQGAWSETTAWWRDGWASLEQTDGWLDIAAMTAEVAWRTTLRSHGMQVALPELEQVVKLAANREWLRLTRLASAWRVDLLVQCGYLMQARQEALQVDLEGIADNRHDWRNHEAATLAMARLQLASGNCAAALTRLRRESKVLQDKGLCLPSWRLQLLTLAAYGKGQSTLEAQDMTSILASIPQRILPGLLLEVGPGLLPALEACPNAIAAQAAILTRLRGWRAHPVRARMPFSAKETQILTLLVSGQPNKMIAQALDISENTVKFHLKHIFAKLSVDNRTAAISAAMRLGVLDPPL